jgi:hypothetical protein
MMAEVMAMSSVFKGMSLYERAVDLDRIQGNRLRLESEE